ncbi:MAG: hypothetical protein FJW26_06850 [Acidimicrobiia bacterium]|nr:hypothetical protein [Acidimicrobiia bacterium]
MRTFSISVVCHSPAFRALLGMGIFGLTVASSAVWPAEYGDSVPDYLNYRPHVTNPSAEEKVLQWGKEQGVPGLEEPTLAARRNAALTAVHEAIAKRYLMGMSLPGKAPDIGVKVRAGKPHVVMFGPEGNVEDQEGNAARIGFERFGHYMWPSASRLRDGQLLVRVYVGGEDPRYTRPPEWLNYLSGDGGRNWRHFACYDVVQRQASKTNERPVAERTFRLADGEEIRFGEKTIEFPDSKIQPYVKATGIRYSSGGQNRRSGNYYRLGDIPRELQGIPLLTRKPGEKKWRQEVSYWDPETLLLGTVAEVRDGEKTSKVVRLVPLGYPWAGDGGPVVQLREGSLLVTEDAQSEIRPMSDLRSDGTFTADSLNYVWRSSDRGRNWKIAAVIPAFSSGPWFVNWRAHLEPRFADGSWVVLYRTRGIYSGAGPMFIRRSTDQGKTWSVAKALRPASSGTMPGLMLANGIAVRAYGRPGAFLMFCGDGKGELWGNDVAVVKPWKTQNDANSCNNPSLAVTGSDRFVFVYSKFDVPDPWGEPRLAIIAQEFIVSRK